MGPEAAAGVEVVDGDEVVAAPLRGVDDVAVEEDERHARRIEEGGDLAVDVPRLPHKLDGLEDDAVHAAPGEFARLADDLFDPRAVVGPAHVGEEERVVVRLAEVGNGARDGGEDLAVAGAVDDQPQLARRPALRDERATPLLAGDESRPFQLREGMLHGVAGEAETANQRPFARERRIDAVLPVEDAALQRLDERPVFGVGHAHWVS